MVDSQRSLFAESVANDQHPFDVRLRIDQYRRVNVRFVKSPAKINQKALSTGAVKVLLISMDESALVHETDSDDEMIEKD